MESRQNFGIGQEAISADSNKIPSRIEKGLFDFIIFQMLGKKQNGFFQNSFNAVYIDTASVLIRAGVGFQNRPSGASEPDNKPIYLDTDTAVNFNAPDASNDRIDLIVVKADLVDGEVATRNYKDATSGEVSPRQFVVSKKWEALLDVVVGTPAPSPVKPAVPAGYIEIHSVIVSAALGIVNQAAITDNRDLLPICTSVNTLGTVEYDAIVGDIPQANYATLAAALLAAQDGWRILCLNNETIDAGAIPTVTNSNIEIVGKNVTISKGTATVGLIIQGDYCKVSGLRFLDFSTAGDFGVFVDGSTYSNITGLRYNNCDNNYDDQGTNTIEIYSIEE